MLLMELEIQNRYSEWTILRAPPVAGKFYKDLGENQICTKFTGRNLTAIGFHLADDYKKAGEPKIMNIIGTLSRKKFQYATTIQMVGGPVYVRKHKHIHHRRSIPVSDYRPDIIFLFQSFRRPQMITSKN